MLRTTFQSNSSVPYIQARTELEKKLLVIWGQVLDIPAKLKTQPGIKDSFSSLGGDPAKAMILVAKICSVFDIDFPVTKIGSLEDLTIETLSSTLFIELTRKNVSRNIQLAKEGDEELEPLFILPPISGESSLTYQKLISVLKTPRKVYVINSPTLIDPVISSCSIKDMAASYLNLIRKIQPHGPINVAGWSSGGLLAYEIAIQAERQNKPAEFVGIIDEPAPFESKEMDRETFANELMDLIGYFGKQHGFSVDIERDALAQLPKEKQIEVVFDRIPLLSSISQNILAHVKNFLLASLSYEPEKLKKTPITIFSTQPTRKKVFSYAKNKGTEETLGWENYSNLYTTYSDISGDHFYIIEKPGELASRIDYSIRLQPTAESKKKASGKLLEEKLLEEILSKAEQSLEINSRKETPRGTPEERLLRIAQAVAMSEQKAVSSNKLVGKMPFFRKEMAPNNEIHAGVQDFTTKIKARL